MSRSYNITSAVVFACVALTHAWRFVLNLQMQLGAWSVPRPVTGLMALAAASMAVWGLRSAKLGDSGRIVYSGH